MAFIQASALSKSFPSPKGARHVLAHVSLAVEQGEFVSIVGAMGTGKSTLLGMLAGLIPADGGAISIAGEPVREFPRRAAFVFQNYSLLPWLTAFENVRLAIEAAFPGLPDAERQDRARAALDRVGLGHAYGRKPRHLSGGMRQRVAIARAFAVEPEVLFLDEPFGALDALTREALQKDLVELCGSTTTVMITNSIEEAILLSDRIVPILAGPPATLGASIAVDLPRPRTAAQLAHDEAASHVRAHVVATLTAQPDRRRRPSSHPGPTASTTLVEVKE